MASLKRPAASTAHHGRHQRSQLLPSAPAQASPSHGYDCELVPFLFKKWAWGDLSAVQVQSIAGKAHADQQSLLRSLGMSTDLASKSLARIAQLGGEGKHPGNIHTQLCNYLGSPQIPPPMIVKAPAIRQKSGGVSETVEMDVPIFLPM